jgi:Tfp pilus assembly protein PilF
VSPTGKPLGNPGELPVDTVIDAYEKAARLPAVEGEARVRLAWLLHRIGRSDDAIAQLAAAAAAPNLDPATRYLRPLVLGHVLLARDQAAEAADAYRAALEVMPSAQSARVGLMNARLMQGDRGTAEGLAESVQAERNTEIDPWWTYWLGQARLYPVVMARLREMAR